MKFCLKKDGKRIVILSLIGVFVIFLASLIFASFQDGNPSHSIEKIYGESTNISGWINLSLDEEPANSVFSSFFDGSEGNSISLEDLLDKNPSYEHSCLPLDCGKDYSVINGESSKTFILNSNESKILGLKISSSQAVTSISSFSLDIDSNASSSTIPQFKIDILDDNETDWHAYQPHEQYNEKNYGCFEEEDAEGIAQIITTQYCEKISLPVFPQVNIGAELQEITGGDVDFTMSISNDALGIYEYCVQNASGEGQINCTISDLKTTQSSDFFVCIRTASQSDNDKYGVRSEQENPCGFTSFFEGEYDFDFEIFAQTSLYDAVGSFILNNTEMQNSGSSGNIENKILSYINEKYGGDCSDDCIIPIRFISNTDYQEIVVSDISLSYVAGISTTTTTIYEVTEDFPIISSDFQRLFLDNAGFTVPSELDNYSFSLKLNSEEIFSEDIEVKDVPIIKSLTPVSTAAGVPTEFEVEVISPTDVNISGYYWDFGDNSTITTPINKTLHIYSVIDVYDLKITAVDTAGLNSSKIFRVNVSSPKNHIQGKLNKLNFDLQNLKTEIQTLGLFQQTSLNSVLKIQNVSAELERLEQEYDAATNESEYMDIVEALFEIRIPEDIFKTKEANAFLFFPEKDYIEMDAVEAIGGGEYNSRKTENYKNAVLAWQQENIDIEIDFAEFSGEYEDVSGVNPFVSIFEIDVDEKKDIVHDYYLIIPELEGIGFNTNVEKSGDFYYVNLRDVSGLNFYTTEEIDFDNLPAFVAPPVDKLVVTGPAIPSDDEKKKRVIIFVLSLVFLVVAGIIAYTVIYHWYKKKYEKYLFKNRNDLYNIVTYVNNSKKRGLSRGETIKNLKKAGWGSEQMRYVMRKYEGKRTGLVELPLTKLMRKAKRGNSPQKQERR